AVIDIFNDQQVEEYRRTHRLDPARIRSFRNRLLKRFLSDEKAIGDLPDGDQLQLHSLALHSNFDSEIDGATKLLFRNEAGLLLETVILRIASGRTTLCVSSQVGCAAACDFCATGKMGIARSLTVAEILDQVVQAGQLLQVEGRSLRNIVFMGMGEPFHNEDNLHQVLGALISAKGFARSPGSLLVSTVGIPDAMVRLADTFPDVNLALSLHSAKQDVRESIIPLAKRFDLEALKSAVRRVNEVHRRQVMVEYLMLKDVNDSESDVQALLSWVNGLCVHVNLIPFNKVESAAHLEPTDRQSVTAFADRLKQVDIKTTIRYSLGNDIAAACGQLVQMENRKRAMEDSHVVELK
ncbi:UNVERIFIED_CONTAM: hypothetical protein GTU68_034200, partial [Idotea baltica]|nr:hypothetical protein [Idotea baltica]